MVQAPRSRPVGVTVIAILAGIVGVLELIVGILALAGGSVSIGIILAIVGIVYLLAAWGLWTEKSWAFWLTVAIAALSIIGTLLTYFGFKSGSANLISLIFPVAILIYMFADRKVRAFFHV